MNNDDGLEPHLRLGAPRSLTSRFEGEHMDAMTTDSVVHFYDVQLRETLCGLRGFEHRSTKHARGVTCHACVGLLRERPIRGRSESSRPPTSGVASSHEIA